MCKSGCGRLDERRLPAGQPGLRYVGALILALPLLVAMVLLIVSYRLAQAYYRVAAWADGRTGLLTFEEAWTELTN